MKNKERFKEKSKILLHDKLTFMSLSIIYEICVGYLENESIEHMEKYKKDIGKYFINMLKILEKDRREEEIANIEARMREMEEDAISIFATLHFCNFLEEVILEEIASIELIDVDEYKDNKEEFLNLAFELIDSLEPEMYGTILSCLPFSMTKESYYDYIKSGIELIKDWNQGDILSYIKGLKFDFCNFNEIINEGVKAKLKEILKVDFKKMPLEKLKETLSKIQDISEEYAQISGNVSAIYNGLISIISIYKYCDNLQEIFEDRFIFKDIFYSTKQMIEEDTFELMCDSIFEKCLGEMEMLSDKIDTLEEELKNRIKCPENMPEELKLSILLDEYHIDFNIEENIYKNAIKVEENNKSIDGEFIKFIIDDFIQYTNSFDFSKNLTKRLKQNLFKKIISPFSANDLKRYFKNLMSSLSDNDGELVFDKLFQTLPIPEQY